MTTQERALLEIVELALYRVADEDKFRNKALRRVAEEIHKIVMERAPDEQHGG